MERPNTPRQREGSGFSKPRGARGARGDRLLRRERRSRERERERLLRELLRGDLLLLRLRLRGGLRERLLERLREAFRSGLRLGLESFSGSDAATASPLEVIKRPGEKGQAKETGTMLEVLEARCSHFLRNVVRSRGLAKRTQLRKQRN